MENHNVNCASIKPGDYSYDTDLDFVFILGRRYRSTSLRFVRLTDSIIFDII